MSEAARFSSPATHHLPLPNEILHIIVFEHCCSPCGEIDYPTLDALSRAASGFRALCQSITFHHFYFNLRRKNIKRRLIQFLDLLKTNPQLATYIRELYVVDNMFPAAYKNERKFPICEPAGDNWFQHPEMDDDEKYHLILDEGGVGAQFSSAILTLSGFRHVVISFLYRSIVWTKLSTHFRRLFQRIFIQHQYLKGLYIQGIIGVPQRLLEIFSSMESMQLLDISIDSNADIIDNADIARKLIRHSTSGRPKLDTLLLRNVPATGALSLLDKWKENAHLQPSYGVDMSCPNHIQIFFGKSAEVEVPKRTILHASTSTTKLWLHAAGLGLDNAAMVDALKKRRSPTHPSNKYPSIHDWFASQALIQPADIAPLTSLEQIKITVSYWPGAETHNEELDWALALLQRVPTDYMHTVIVAVNIGGYAGTDASALKDFHRNLAQTWTPWRVELRQEKWLKLEYFKLELQMPEYGPNATGLGISISQFMAAVSDEFPMSTFNMRKTIFQIHHMLRINSGLRLLDIYQN